MGICLATSTERGAPHTLTEHSDRLPGCLPGNAGQGDELAGLGGSVEALGSDGLHGDDGHIPPAHLHQPLDHSTQEASAPYRQHDGPWLFSHRLLQLLHDGRVAFPGRGGWGRGVQVRAGLPGDTRQGS